MKSLWVEKEARKFRSNPLKMRVYTSRLLGKNPDLVMHGGGNTSVKILKKNLFNEREQILYVKGSGWDLATIEQEGFAPVKMDTLLKMAQLKELSDIEMVKNQRVAMTDPTAPNPSVEAILHAIIPFKFVDHTHADAAVTITNTPNGREYIKKVYGEKVLIVPYVMPGFILARKIFEMTQNIDWSSLEGMILLNHGVFTFNDDARVSYEKMIRIVSQAEQFIKKNDKRRKSIKYAPVQKLKQIEIARLRQAVNNVLDKPILACTDDSIEAVNFSRRKDLEQISQKGPITPDHIIRTKRNPAVISQNIKKSIERFVTSYVKYFNKFNEGKQMLDPAPRWAIFPGHGSVFFGSSIKATQIISDIASHTQKCIQQAENMGGWKPLPQKSLFEMEYWSLEQAKLGKVKSGGRFTGKIAIVTGAASGIGRAAVLQLISEGAAVCGVDLDNKVRKVSDSEQFLPIQGDLTSPTTVKKTVNGCASKFGGIDMLVLNAGIFPPSAEIENNPTKSWAKTMSINLDTQHELLKECIPFLKLGFKPSVVLVGSKNVQAPGPGAVSYSVSKAAATQLARVAALELGQYGININVVHPNAVFDTSIWTDEVLKKRAKNYQMSVEEYKANNLLGVEINSMDVARLISDMLGPSFSKTTAAQVPIDGGNDRVI